MRLLCLLLLIPVLRADEATLRMMARVSEEAEAFKKLAPEVLGQETLHQRSLRPQGRFHPRVGNGPAQPGWQERTIVSEYGFTSFSDGAESSSLHELRQVTSVDGKKIEDSKKAQQVLAKAITSSDDSRKKQLLKQFEKYGLLGAVTDYGQALLLFTRQNLERYEFTGKGANSLNGQSVLVFHYQADADGPETITVIEENNNNKVKHLPIEGELWVRSDNFVPVRITMVATQTDAPDRVKEEAAIDYAMSPYGALLPVKTEHRETRWGKIDAENQFLYTDFKKFGASTDIKFDTAK